MTTYTPKPGDIGLTAIAGRMGKAIRIGQYLNGDGWHDYQHAFMYVGNGDIVEAMPGGALLSDLEQYRGCDVAWLKCPDKYRQAVAEAARGYVGVPYSFLDYGSLALHRFHIPAPRLRKYIADSGHMICSQLVDQAAMDGGWHIFDDQRWPGYVTPGSLHKVYRTQQDKAGGEPIERWKDSH